MERRHYAFLIVIALVALWLVLFNSKPSHGAIVETKSLISGGGAHSSAGTVAMSANVGDPIAGSSKESPHDVVHGFYGKVLTQLVGVDGGPQITFQTYLGAITPNPARTPLTITFGNALRQSVSLEIYDVAGRLVRTLHAGPLHAGVFSVPWDLRTRTGQPVGTGVYFVRLATPDFQRADRMVVVR